MTEYTFDQGGEVRIDYAKPGDVFRIVGPHTRLDVRNGGAFNAPPFVIVGQTEDAGFTEAADHDIRNCKNVTLRGLQFGYRVHFWDRPGTEQQSGGLHIEDCVVEIPVPRFQAIKVTPAPGSLIDGVAVVRCALVGGDAYLGEPGWATQPDGQKEEIANVEVVDCHISGGYEGVQIKAARRVAVWHNIIEDILPPTPEQIWEGAINVDDGTADVLVAYNRVFNCYGCGVSATEYTSGALDIYANLFLNCAQRPYRYYPGVVYVSKRGGVRVLNNTIIGSGVDGVNFSDRVPSGLVQNNIILGVGGEAIHATRFDPGGPNDTTGAISEYGFTPDWHLTADSPGVGAGIAHDLLGVDMDGWNYDRPPSMGCYEFVPVAPPPTDYLKLGAVYRQVVVGAQDGVALVRFEVVE